MEKQAGHSHFTMRETVPAFISLGTIMINIGMNKKGKDRDVTWRVIRYTTNLADIETQCIAVYFPPE